MRSAWLLGWALIGIVPISVFGQGDRRDRRDPELIIQSGGRRGTCDVLAFTADGQFLLAAGDDKVVHVWQMTDKGLAQASCPVLRWSTWRDQRGAIYSLAIDNQGKRVAVGGLGVQSSCLAIIDLRRGEILHALNPEGKPGENFFSVRAAAFSPLGQLLAFGTGDGSVWLWDGKSAVRRLGKHGPSPKGTINRVRFLHFFNERRLLSVAEEGEVISWDLGADEPTHQVLFHFPWRLYRAALSPDGKWLAGAALSPHVALYSLDGKNHKDIELGPREFPRSIAFTPQGDRLAVGVGRLLPEAHFYMETDNQIRFYNLSEEALNPKPGPVHVGRAEFLAFHPGGAYLAVAGGNHHQVTLWKLSDPSRPVSIMEGVGQGFWDVALSKEGRFLGIRTERDQSSLDPNARGKGPWKVFDLQKRLWGSAAEFQPLPKFASADNWQVAADTKDPYLWYAVDNQGNRHVLPLDGGQEGMPLCYTFLETDEKHPTRLIVGHYWGLSVYELSERGARRIRLGAGHQGEVTALAVSADRRWVVSASNDQTVSAWSLEPFPSQGELGANFQMEEDRLHVHTVDLFSPAWEAGLRKGDEIVLLAVAGRKVFDRLGGEYGQPVGQAAEAWEILKDPRPGRELFFGVRRPGQKALVKMITTVRQRPLWRFFPTRTHEWVLWMWRYPYYDTSTNGDSFVGWQINNGTRLEATPTFYRAEQFRDFFYRPEVLDRLLATRRLQEALPANENTLAAPDFRKLEPPSVAIEVAVKNQKPEIRNQKSEMIRISDFELLMVTVRAKPQSDNPDFQPDRAELWLNDYRFRSWEPRGQRFEDQLTVPASMLRTGENLLTFQCYNRVEGRGIGRAEVSVAVQRAKQPGQPALHALVVGIADYRQSTDFRGQPLMSLPGARNDAREFFEFLKNRKDSLYKRGQFNLLPNDGEKVNRVAILNHLKSLADPHKVHPDDLFVLFLAGHGNLHTEKGKTLFVLCCPDYNPQHYTSTSVTSLDLYESLAVIPCRKIVFLDACRSGDLAATPVRDLTPGGKGPTILAACDRNQCSFENPKLGAGGHGLFTYALLRALGDDFGQADKDPKNGELDFRELFTYVEDSLPNLLKAVRKDEGDQTPVSFPAELEKIPFRRK